MKEILLALALTLLLEEAVAALWGLRGRDLALCALVNLLTNPLVNLAYLLFRLPLWVVLLLECVVVAVEWRLYRGLGERVRRPFALSLTANLVSFLLGGFIVVFYFWRWLL